VRADTNRRLKAVVRKETTVTIRNTLLMMGVALLAAGWGHAAPLHAAQAPARDQVTPTLAYNPDMEHFMAMWVEDRGDGPNIYAKLLFANGLPQGGPERRGTGVIRSAYGETHGRRQAPSLVYNTDGDEYYLVWSEERTPDQGEDVYGVRVSAAGYARSDPRLLVGGPGDQTDPSVAYNSDNQTYLIVWQDDASDVQQIWGLRVRGNGIPNGAALKVVDEPSNAQDPTVARNGEGYLVAWVDDRNGNADIYARRLNANALPVGGQQGQIYAMASSPEDELAPSLNPASGSLVYNVYNPMTGLDIVGVRVYDTGTTGGQRPVGIAVPAADQASPVTAAGSETVVLYADNRSGEFDLYAIRIQNNRPKGRDYPVLKDGYMP
jgi:hypothetical protein